MTITSKGKILTDFSGRSLYIFDKDSKGISNCTGSCTAVWPPFSVGSFPSNLPENLTAIQRSDGSMQLAWKEKPLYFYASDQSPGDVNGDGVNGVWHLVKL